MVMANFKPTHDVLIRNCARVRGEDFFDYKCPLKWDNLAATEQDGVRFCDQCQREVYLVATDEELGRAVRLNQCIAMEIPEDLQARAYRANSPFLMGRPNSDLGQLTKALMER